MDSSISSVALLVLKPSLLLLFLLRWCRYLEAVGGVGSVFAVMMMMSLLLAAAVVAMVGDEGEGVCPPILNSVSSSSRMRGSHWLACMSFIDPMRKRYKIF